MRGCDVERCPRCKGQTIACRCVGEVNGIIVPADLDFMDSFEWLEEHHPEFYDEGPDEEMYAKWDAEWGDKRLRWTGAWPGKLECRELGFWCRDLDAQGNVVNVREALDIQNAGGRIRWQVPCEAGDEGAHEDLNRYAMYVATCGQTRLAVGGL
jgi:hypothetical protein